ncbi:hypothetical protein CISIN_1g034897mg [Citrus sinensis]|uniref:Uncharacterized protein n=1 Tax=Citrus sinensis TaxID=2711 RepID=A0A067ECM7_CITSI|nr:hypothetical protein CISIN_1g034897mg [Citrus sinensis]
MPNRICIKIKSLTTTLKRCSNGHISSTIIAYTMNQHGLLCMNHHRQRIIYIFRTSTNRHSCTILIYTIDSNNNLCDTGK